MKQELINAGGRKKSYGLRPTVWMTWVDSAFIPLRRALPIVLAPFNDGFPRLKN
jgi:hypothetical protein